MPTVILLDVSLSMTQPVSSTDESISSSEPITKRQLAEAGLTTLLDFIAANDKLEFTTLVIFSSLWEIVVPFTRDYNELKKAVHTIEIFDKTCLETVLDGVKNVVVEEWGASTLCQVFHVSFLFDIIDSMACACQPYTVTGLTLSTSPAYII